MSVMCRISFIALLIGSWVIQRFFISRRCCLASLRRADRSSRGALPNMVRRCAGSRNPKNEGAMASDGPQRHRKKMFSIQQYE